MADAVATIVLLDDGQQYIAHFTNVSDGTGESNILKVDKDTIAVVKSTGIEATALDIEQIEWNIQGFNFVKISWDHAADSVAAVLCGSGYKDFRGGNGQVVNKQNLAGLQDPKTADSTGDVLFTTSGAVATQSYDITLYLRKRP